MPTFAWVARFRVDFRRLSPEQQAAFIAAIAHFVQDLNEGQFRKGLRVKGVKGAQGVYEMTWGDDGRATFQYGPEINPGQRRIIWRRIGTHEVLRQP